MRYRYTALTWRNAAWLPFVVVVRVPIMTTLLALQTLGEAAERAGDFLGSILPGFEKKRVPLKGCAEPKILPKVRQPATPGALDRGREG